MKYLLLLLFVVISTALKISTENECHQKCPKHIAFVCKYISPDDCYQFFNECDAELYACEHKITFVNTVQGECPKRCKQN
ncbi:hypothetical protein PVAND_015204 [Polypedilum vanderplanki]|uniref:Uncharacterized protein n=1 Tax=Polypedilum vanderplanki TaxID=319348 RepID=A0A9J6BBY3_POLVA|nr:hypothetical protein PVAND_015204 [Polypedilum vanderplanki]